MLLDLVQDAGAGLGEAAAGQPRGQIVAGLDQGRDADMPSGTSITRFSTMPLSPTTITSARPGDSGTNSICLNGRSLIGAATMPA